MNSKKEFIHPTAIVEDGASIGKNCQIGAYALISDKAKIGDDCSIAGHAQILGNTNLGIGCSIGAGAVLGGDPQDTSFDPDTESGLQIGDNCTIRELVTIHRSAQKDGWTKIGANNFFMVSSHVGHDAVLGDGNIIANLVMIAGHVWVGDRCFLGGGAGVHQFVRVGDLTMVAGLSRISLDVPPFTMVSERNELTGINNIALRRAKILSSNRLELKKAYREVYFGEGRLAEKIESSESQNWSDEARQFF